MNINVIGAKCCGCHNCEHICSLNAIKFEDNGEGFFYPKVSSCCKECGKCLTVCPMYGKSETIISQKGFAAYCKNSKALMRSSSGGVFYSLAKYVIEQGGVVIGCAEKQIGYPEHILVESIENLHLLQGSKYVESNFSNVYDTIDRVLKQNKLVMFSGTPCQVAAVKKMFQSDRLITIDIICHGVPSRKMYDAYLKWFEQKKNCQIENFNFRSKKKHGWSLTYKVNYKKNRKSYQIEKIASLSPYYEHFLEGMDYRECCYLCKYAASERGGDITLGDFWGVEKVKESLANFNGVSAVLINTNKGKRLFELVSNSVNYEEVLVSSIVKNNGQLNNPVVRPIERNEIYELLNTAGYDFIANHYRNKKGEIIDSIKDFIPNKLRIKIKKCVKRNNKWK